MSDITAATASKYSIYTTEYDEVIHATGLADHEELVRLRGFLDTNKNQTLSKALGRSFSAMSEAGKESLKGTAVAILMDNSGSERGRYIYYMAGLADMLAPRLERLGVKNLEILGHTTRLWKGGRAREDWILKGKPENPGRMNELRIVEYKTAAESVTKSRKNLALMMREGLLKENIDGDALDYAAKRLLQTPADRHILLYLGDLTPVDDATMALNGSALLVDHLSSVIDGIHQEGKIELKAIGLRKQDLEGPAGKVEDFVEIDAFSGKGPSERKNATKIVDLFEPKTQAVRGAMPGHQPIEIANKL